MESGSGSIVVKFLYYSRSVKYTLKVEYDKLQIQSVTLEQYHTHTHTHTHTRGRGKREKLANRLVV